MKFQLLKNFSDIYLPALLYEIVLGAIIPVIPLLVIDYGGGVVEASFISSLLFVGQIIGDLPAGYLATKLGEKKTMLIGALLAVLIFITIICFRSIGIFGLGIFILGGINSIFLLARQSYLTAITPIEFRGRAMSALGAASRVGLFIGPIIGSLFIYLFSTIGSVYFALGVALLTFLALLKIKELNPKELDISQNPESALTTDLETKNEVPKISFFLILKTHFQQFLTLGSAVFLIAAIRGIRQLIIPLWCENIGMADDLNSLIFGIGSLFDILAIYPAAKLIDSKGRLWAGIPALVLMSLSIMALPFFTNYIIVTIIVIIMGIGNGFSTGIIMTYGADLAPANYRAKFLSIWRLFSDSGNAFGPLSITALLNFASYIFAGVLSGLYGLIAIILLIIYSPKFINPFHLNQKSLKQKHGQT